MGLLVEWRLERLFTVKSEPMTDSLHAVKTIPINSRLRENSCDEAVENTLRGPTYPLKATYRARFQRAGAMP
jgi:hypothetical protein